MIFLNYIVNILQNHLDRGLMQIPDNYIFRPGEKVVVLAKGPWEGEMASVSNECSVAKDDDRVLVDLSCDWMDSTNTNVLNSKMQQHSFLKSELAMWSFPDADDSQRPAAMQKSNDRLMKLLSSLSLEKKITATNQSKPKISESSYKRKSVSKRKK